METNCLKFCFGNSYSMIQNLFNNYSPENSIELSFNEIPDEIFRNGIYETEYFGKILTTFAGFKFKIEHEKIENEFQVDGEREIVINRIQYQNGFAKYSNLTPITDKSGIDFEKSFSNILYIRKLSLSVNLFQWRVSKIVKITSPKKNHKKLIWNYSIEDVIHPKNFTQIYFKFEYFGFPQNITESFIDVMNQIYPREFRIFNRIWFSINKSINVDSLEPVIKNFNPLDSVQKTFSIFKYGGSLETIVEFNCELFEIGNSLLKIGKSKFKGLRVFKCTNRKIISVLFDSNPEIPITELKFAKIMKNIPKDFSYLLSFPFYLQSENPQKTEQRNLQSIETKDFQKNLLKTEFQRVSEIVIVEKQKSINFLMKNGYLYLKGCKNEIICRDSLTNHLSLKHHGYSLLDTTIKNDEEVFILFYLPFNHKPQAKERNHDGIVKCRLNDRNYEIIEYLDQNSLIDSYQHGLEISISNYTRNEIPKEISEDERNPSFNQFVYEKFLNRIQMINMIFVIDENSTLNPEILKRVSDINSIFLVSKSRYRIGSFIKRVSESVNVKIPQLMNIDTKIYNKQNIDISVLNNIENIFMFTNFSINSVNVILIFDSVSEEFLNSFESLHKSIISQDCLIIIKNNPELVLRMTKLFNPIDIINFGSDEISIFKSF